MYKITTLAISDFLYSLSHLNRFSVKIFHTCAFKTQSHAICNDSVLYLYLGCLPPLLQVPLCQTSPLLPVLCCPGPHCPLPLLEVVKPSSSWSSSGSFTTSSLPLCASYCPPIIIHSGYMSCPFPSSFCYGFQNIIYSRHFSNYFIWKFFNQLDVSMIHLLYKIGFMIIFEKLLCKKKNTNESSQVIFIV